MEADWIEAARQGAAADLEQAVRDCARAQARVASLRAIVDALSALSGSSASPRQDVPDAAPAPSHLEAVAGGVVLPGPGSAEGTRSIRIRALLDAEPARRWKAREIADEVGVQNVRSMRGTLQTMVERGEIQRDSDAWYLSVRDAAPAGVDGRQAAM